MNTQELETFITIAETLNFARAADLLNVTQSTVSRQLHSLETELGVRLFDRSTRSVSLTPAGISFLADAKDTLGKLNLAVKKLQTNSKTNIQILSIGCSNEADLSFLSMILSVCRDAIPGLRPHIRIIPYRSIINYFIQGKLDVLFGFRNDIPLRSEIAYKELMQIPICCAVNSDHPLAAREVVTEQDILSGDFVVCNAAALPSDIGHIQDHLKNYFPVESIYHCDDLPVMLTLIKSGCGAAILPAGISAESSIKYITLKNARPISYGIFYKNSSKNRLIKEFVSITIQESTDFTPSC